MRLLFLTTETPWPRDSGGKVRSFETLAALAGLGRVAVASVSERPAEEGRGLAEALPAIEVLAPVPHRIRIRRDPAALARALLHRVARGEPYLAAKFRSRALRASVEQLCGRSPPDVVWCDHLNVFPLALEAARRTGAALVLDAHNVESALVEQLLGRAAHVPPGLLEARAARRFEADAVARADAVVAIGPSDAAALARLGGHGRVSCVLPAVEPLVAKPPPAGPRVVFLGTLSWPPNLEAARWLGGALGASIRARLPGAELVVGGGGLAPAEQARLAAAGLVLPGRVPDARAFFRSGAVAVVPLRTGSGISIKTLDSLAAAVPTVCTAMGARGLGLRDGREVLLAEDEQALAAAIARAATDEPLRAGLVAAATAHLQRHHSRAALTRAYEGVLERALLRRAARLG